MVARAGANLRHIAPTHPAARRCGSLTLPHRRSAPRKPAGRQKRHRRTSPPQRRRTNAAEIGVGVAERIGGYAPPRPAPLAAAGVRGERKARANAGGDTREAAYTLDLRLVEQPKREYLGGLQKCSKNAVVHFLAFLDSICNSLSERSAPPGTRTRNQLIKSQLLYH